MRKQKGFSLIELLIVVAIILIIAAIAIPNLLRARIAANESSAVSSIRTINTAMVTYNSSYPTVGYSTDLKSLGGATPCIPASTSACLIDNVLALDGTPAGSGKSGYNIAAAGVAAAGLNTTYIAGAAPLKWNQTGVRRFCAVEDAVVRADPNSGGSTTPENTHDTCLGNPYVPLNQ